MRLTPASRPFQRSKLSVTAFFSPKKIRHTTMTPKLSALHPPSFFSISADVHGGQMQIRYQRQLSSTEWRLGRLQSNLMNIHTHTLAHQPRRMALVEARVRKRSSHYVADQISIFRLAAGYPGPISHIMNLVNRHGHRARRATQMMALTKKTTLRPAEKT